MKIEINPRSLLNLEHIVEVLYKLHPSVLEYLIEMERSLGKIIGMIDLNNISLEEREFLADTAKVLDYSTETLEEVKKEINPKSLEEQLEEAKKDIRETRFHELRKYIQLRTDEYIPMKIFVEVEDPVIGKKVKELVEALEKTRAPEQFYFHKNEVDENAYFAEGYGLTTNEEQRMKKEEFNLTADYIALLELLIKEKLYHELIRFQYYLILKF